MKNKTIVLILICIIVAVLILIGVYFFVKQNLAGGPENNGQQNINNGLEGQNTSNQTNLTDSNNQTTKNKLATDDFEITLSDGWKGVPATAGISAMAIDTNESITDPDAQKINFKTYLAVSYDTLKGKNMTEYMQLIKTALLQTMPDTVFSNENILTINNRQASALEAEMTNQGVNFKVLMVVVKGNGDDIWIMSFNSLKNSWQQYAQTFSDIASSFILKQK